MTLRHWVFYDLLAKATAWHFLYYLRPEKIRGTKKIWCLVSCIPILGPLATLAVGVRYPINFAELVPRF